MGKTTDLRQSIMKILRCHRGITEFLFSRGKNTILVILLKSTIRRAFNMKQFDAKGEKPKYMPNCLKRSVTECGTQYFDWFIIKSGALLNFV